MNVRQFEQEVWPYRQRLSEFIFPLVGYDPDDVQDVLQETLFAAAKTLHIFRGDSSLYTWLCGIAWHKAMDHRRRMWYRRGEGREISWQALESLDHLVRDPEDEELVEPPDTASTPDEALERKLVRQEIARALQALRPHHCQVLMLKYLCGLKVEEIAYVLGESFKAVESRLTLARKAFRATYERQQMLPKGA